MKNSEILESKIVNSRIKLKKKFSLQQIVRGKGVSRRKKKNIRYKLKKQYKITPEEKNLNACIKRINEMIYKLDNIEEYENAITYIDDIIYFHFLDISKEDTLNKNIYKIIKEKPCVFFEENFYQEIENDKILIKKNTYNILRNFFNNYGISSICNLFLKIEKCLTKKDYLLEL